MPLPAAYLVVPAQIEADGIKSTKSTQENNPVPPWIQPLRHHNIHRYSRKPPQSQRMRQPDQRKEQEKKEISAPTGLPNNSQRNKGQSQREVKIEEAHVERPAISEHGQKRKCGPGRAPTGDRGQSKRSPNKD